MLIRGVDGDIPTTGLYKRKGLVPMVTYDNLFSFVTMLCSVITLVIAFFHTKK